MLTFLISFGLVILGFLFIFEIAAIIVYGIVTSKEITAKYMNLDQTKLYLNSYDRTLLLTFEFNYLCIRKLTFLSRLIAEYYISDVGMVLRWSKLHKRIKEYYKIAELNLKNHG